MDNDLEILQSTSQPHPTKKQRIGLLAIASIILTFAFHSVIFPHVSTWLDQLSPAYVDSAGLHATGQYENLTRIAFADEKIFLIFILATMIFALLGLRKNQTKTSKYISLFSLILLGIYLYVLYPLPLLYILMF